MYSSKTRPALPELRFPHARRAALVLALLVTVFWAMVERRPGRIALARDGHANILVVPLIAFSRDPRRNARLEERVRRFLSFDPGETPAGAEGLREVRDWLARERVRLTGSRLDALRFTALPPVAITEAPPRVPRAEDELVARWRGRREWLEYLDGIAERSRIDIFGADVTLWICFFDIYDRDTRDRWDASRCVAFPRDGTGIVFAPLGDGTTGHIAALAAHEICHLFGATDKSWNDESVWPEGYVDPERDPRWPQPGAEIMSLLIPVAPGEEDIVDSIHRCTIGERTAAELGW